ncbi:hypothetical protein UY3_14433 [Chelonia mydas]|uniref:Uncharacterized protein n=1 Tax=Chelonia mydas TaxID=8469 RepID=M7AUR9_CHEMY|nr:hypothetical protein UY3_14433 [Chelonia mydas]
MDTSEEPTPQAPGLNSEDEEDVENENENVEHAARGITYAESQDLFETPQQSGQSEHGSANTGGSSSCACKAYDNGAGSMFLSEMADSEEGYGSSWDFEKKCKII